MCKKTKQTDKILSVDTGFQLFDFISHTVLYMYVYCAIKLENSVDSLPGATPLHCSYKNMNKCSLEQTTNAEKLHNALY